ncbi:MAG: WYL domain-containing protein [Bacteroidetes bacterium]|nr:WYL domain-containing protein [Bacteroidota bacterium]MBK8658932.1 WYL domain-containing protein [Bacteroidota bacterium]
MSENYNYAKSGNAQRKQMHYSPNLLSTINNAIDNCKVSFLEYDSREKGVSKREVEPMAIVYKDRKRHLVAFCRLRNEYRSFRLDRLNLIRIEKEEFVPRQDFKVDEFQDSTDGGAAYEDYEEEN